MLRINICPAIGLSNCSVGRLIYIVDELDVVQPHEDINQAAERLPREGIPTIPSLLVQFSTHYTGAIGALRSTRISQDSFYCAERTQTVLIDPHNFKGIRGLPVSVAHAMSMHKSQSLTLPYTIIDPRQVFCMGALYLSFSRAPSLDRIALISKVTREQLNRYRNQVQQTQEIINGISSRGSCIATFVHSIRSYEESLLQNCS